MVQLLAAAASSQVEPVERFIRLIAPYSDLWPSARFGYSTVLQGGEWKNLFSCLRFDWTVVRELAAPERVVEAPRIRAGTLHLSFEAAVNLIRQAAGGFVEIEESRVHLDSVTPNPDGGSTVNRYGWTPWRVDGNGRRWNIGNADDLSLQGFGLSADGGRAAELLGQEEWLEVNNALLTAARPRGGLSELTSGYLGFEEPKTLNHSLTFDVTARLATQIIQWAVEDDGKFKGRVLSPVGVAPSQLDVAAILNRGTAIDRMHVGLAEANEIAEFGLARRNFEFEFRGYDSVELHLMLRGVQVQELELRFPSPETPNPRMLALLALGRVGDLLNDSLDKAGTIKNADRLEQLVAWILHLAGFQVMQTDFPPMKGGEADMVAFDPYSRLHLLVEVTARDPLNNEKLSKLRRRADDLRGVLPGGETIYAVVAAPGRDSFLPTESRIAAELGIGLMTKNDLLKFIDLASQNQLPSRILKEVVLKRAT